MNRGPQTPLRFKAVIFLSLLCSLFPSANPGPEEQPHKISIIFRYDDYSSLSPTDFERRLIDTFQKHGAVFTAGIIPYVARGDWLDISPQDVVPLSEEKSALMRKAIADRVVEPVQHGYSHQTATWPSDTPSEFTGLDSEKQRMRMERGKKLLESKLGVEINIFIPPWNTNDKNTLKCLEQLGFKCISPSPDSTSDKDSTLKFLPYTVYITGLRRAVESARRLPCPHPVIVVLFHPSEFAEVDRKLAWFTFEEFESLLDWITSQEDIDVTTIGMVINAEDFGVARFERNKATYLLQRFIHPSLLHALKFSTGVYACSQYLSKSRFKIWLLLVGYIVIIVSSIAFISYRAGRLLFFKRRMLGFAAFMGTLLVLIFSVIYITKDHSISYRGFALILALSGVLLGTSFSLYFSKTKGPR